MFSIYTEQKIKNEKTLPSFDYTQSLYNTCLYWLFLLCDHPHDNIKVSLALQSTIELTGLRYQAH